MTSQVVRLYAFAASLLAFFLAWAGIAAHPWASSTARGPSDRSLAAYEQRVQADATLLQALAAKTSSRAAGPAVRIVTLPPLTTTRTS